MALPAYIDASTGAITDGEAWVAIATTTLGSDTATVTFTSTDDGQVGDWSQYMDLVLIAYARGETAAIWDNGLMRFNNDTGSNYSWQVFVGDGSSVIADSGTTTGVYIRTLGTSAGTNEFAAVIAHLFDINSGKYKSVVTQAAADSDGDGFVRMGAGTWKSQAAITEIDLVPGSGNLLAGSSFSLFGVLPRMVA